MQDLMEAPAQLVRVGQQHHYTFHMFVCTNRRNNARSCGGSGSEHILNFAKRHLRSIHDRLDVNVRISSSGCMGRCEHGPVIVVYPQGIWYRCDSRAEVEEIINRHLRDHMRSDSLNLAG